MMAANYDAKGDPFVADKPRVWSEKPPADTGVTPNYDLTPDSKRIAALISAEKPGAQKAQNHVIFLENFFDDLHRKAPLSGK